LKDSSHLKNYINEIEAYREDFLDLIRSIDLGRILQIADLLFVASIRGSNVYVCGNGGSAALSQHFAIDLGLGTRKLLGEGGCRIFDLSSNSAVLTATSNDLGFEEAFSRQIELIGSKDDVLIAISASGKSKNVINAILKAKEIEMITIGLTGFDGGKVLKLVQHSIHVPSRTGEYGKTEDSHSYVLHLLTHLTRRIFMEA